MKQIVKNGLLVFFSLVIALKIAEVGLWLGGIEYPNFYEFDPHLGGKLRPGGKGYWLEEGGGYVSINSDGLRDREHSLIPPPNTLRIAVLGDSFAEAKQVNQEEAFWAVMEKELQNCGNLRGRQVEVINFGISGFGTTQELLMLRHRVWKYSPDIVLLAFFTGNDVADNSPALMQWEWNPYFSYRNGKLVLHEQHTQEKWSKIKSGQILSQEIWWLRFKAWLKDNSRIYQVFQQVRKVAGIWWSPKEGEEDSAAEYRALKIIYQEPTDAALIEAWKATEAVLRLMRDEVAAKGARFFVAVLTHAHQVHPDPLFRKNLACRLGVPHLFYADFRVQNFCRQEGIPMLLLAPSFQAQATTRNVYFHGFEARFGFGGNLGFGHWNPRGHALAGKLIAGWLCGQYQ